MTRVPIARRKEAQERFKRLNSSPAKMSVAQARMIASESKLRLPTQQDADPRSMKVIEAERLGESTGRGVYRLSRSSNREPESRAETCPETGTSYKRPPRRHRHSTNPAWRAPALTRGRFILELNCRNELRAVRGVRKVYIAR